MRPLTVDDLIPLTEYVPERAEHAAAAARYLDRYRRVRVGPKLTFLFENRQTLWFRLQELLRVARLTDPALVQQELDWYNRLLPARGRLQAALHIEIREGSEWAQEMALWRGLSESAVTLRIGSSAIAAQFITCRPEDRAIGAEHWAEFTMDEAARAALADRRATAHIAVEHGGYSHQSGSLSDMVRQSLLDDLTLSDRDQAA